MTDYTIAAGSTEYWTHGSSAGAGDASSFADRKAIPTDIDQLRITRGGELVIVQETQDGHIELGHDTNDGKAFQGYGTLRTVDGSNEWNPDNAYTTYIGGSSGHAEGLISIYSNLTRVHNIAFHQDTSGNPTGTTTSYTDVHGFCYFENCTFKGINYYGVRPIGGGYYKNCTIHGGQSGTDYCVYIANDYSPTLVFDNCSYNTSATYWLKYYGANMIIIGDFTKSGTGGGSIYLLANNEVQVEWYRNAYLIVKDADSNALSSVYFAGFEDTGTIEQYNTAGITGADGKCKAKFMMAADKIPCLDKRDYYYVTANGAKTWGTPDSTEDFGDYTFFFYKSGYQAKTETHDFTDGSDWGSTGTPQTVTLSTAGAGGATGRMVQGMV